MMYDSITSICTLSTGKTLTIKEMMEIYNTDQIDDAKGMLEYYLVSNDIPDRDSIKERLNNNDDFFLELYKRRWHLVDGEAEANLIKQMLAEELNKEIEVVVYADDVITGWAEDNNLFVIKAKKSAVERWYKGQYGDDNFDEWYNSDYTADDTIGLYNYLVCCNAVFSVREG